jgi:hypothetical protein
MNFGHHPCKYGVQLLLLPGSELWKTAQKFLPRGGGENTMDGQRESLLQLRIPVGRTTDIVLLQLLHVCLLASFLPAFKLRLGQQQPESQKRDQNNNHAFPIRKYSSIYRIFFSPLVVGHCK